MKWQLIGLISITIATILYYANSLKGTHQVLESTGSHNNSKTIKSYHIQLEQNETYHNVMQLELAESHNKFRIDDRVTIEMPFNIVVTKNFHHVLPRAAYFDRRTRGKHKNATVLLTHLTSNVKLVACKINNCVARAFEVKHLKLNKWLHQKFSDCTHENVLIFCYNTPGQNNSNVSIVYRNPENESEYISVESEYPLFVPKERKSYSSVMVCTIVFDTPPHFGAWIRYQKTLGVDMVRINAHESFLSSSSFNDTFFLESLHNGFIQLKVWKEHLQPGATFYHSQALFTTIVSIAT